MSKTKTYVQDFLDEVGYSLGYDERSMPDFSHIETIWKEMVPIWEYNGMSEEEYYNFNPFKKTKEKE